MIDRKLQTARRNLLDVSRRNRLLNFKANGRRSLRLLEEDLGAIYQRLVQEAKTLEFMAAEEAGIQPLPAEADADLERATEQEVPHAPAEALAIDDSGGASAAAEDLPPDPISQPHRKSFEQQLATGLAAEPLDARLLFLDREAESALQEQGCNILYVALGLVEWVDPQGEKAPSIAPLVLVPVDLIRRDARQRHRLRLLDDEPVVNPTLAELCRSNFRFEVPQLDVEAERPLETFFQALEAKTATLRGWRVRREAHLGLFSFAKLLMYLDLDPERWPEGQTIRDHPLVAALCGVAGSLEAPARLLSPAEIDEQVHPRDTFQVLDADSSQQVAILAAKNGANLVIEGPPGTGKSQTIANIIAECLAAEKTVLFVAEKAAALDVVKRRLDGVGLGGFVLSMHSRKASKRAIVEELDRSLRTEYPSPPPAEFDADELERLRGKLNGYFRVLHERIVPLQSTLFEALGQCVSLQTAPEAAFELPDLAAWDRKRLTQAEQWIESFGQAAVRAGDASSHPWRGVAANGLTLVERQQLPGRLDSLEAAVVEFQKSAVELAERLRMAHPVSQKDSQDLAGFVELVLAAPSIDGVAATNAAWNSPPADAHAAISSGRRLAELRSKLAPRWQASAEDVDWRPVRERRLKQIKTWSRWWRLSWYRDTWQIRRHLADGHLIDEHQVDGHQVSKHQVERVDARDPALLADLLDLIELRQLKAEIQLASVRGRKLFGKIWHDDASEWEALDAYAQAMEAIRACLQKGLANEAGLAEAMTPDGRHDLSHAWNSCCAAGDRMLAAQRQLVELLKLDLPTFLGGESLTFPWSAWQQRLRECRAAVDRVQDWIDYDGLRRQAADAGLSGFLSWCGGGGRGFDCGTWPQAFRRQFYRLWVELQFGARPELRDCRADGLEGFVRRFGEADRHWLQASRTRLAAQLAARRPQQGMAVSRNSKLGILQAEVRRKRGLKPIRQLLALAGDAVQSLKPCFMMSPISAAQYLEPGKLKFDLVIFDEASQVEPADALGAIARGRQLILVGDEKQLPPTSFFAAVNAVVETDAAPDDVSTADLESVLGMGQVCLPLTTTLRWHYRSRHSSLIEFSNAAFYEGDLRVFPSPCLRREEAGLSLRRVSGTYLRGKGQYNPDEARLVAQEVLRHAREPHGLSLGVGAFSMQQQRAIEDQVEALRREQDDPALAEFFSNAADEPFFVKNLETIQGDERDVIFLSVGYGPDEQGKISMNFGPLNREGGWRRLNVLVTRARERCVVFSSLAADQVRVEPATPRGVRALKEFLHFAEQGTAPVPRDASAGGVAPQTVTPLVGDLARELQSRGWTVHPNVGCAGFALDLAVVDPQSPDRYLLGIECDGAAWQAAATARDRDRLRQTVLEGLGWKLHRVWSFEWLTRREQTLAKVISRLGELAVPPGGSIAPKNGKRRDGPLGRSEDAKGARSGDMPATPAKAPAKVPGRVNDQLALDEDPSSLEGPPPGIEPYRRFAGRLRGDRQRLLRSRRDTVAKVLAEIVAAEGPIHAEELLRVAASLYGARVSGEVKTLLEEAVESGAAAGRFELRAPFVWPVGMVRPQPRWRGGEDAVTDAGLICPEEVAAAAAWVVGREFGIPLDDLPAAALRILGFKRLGPQLAELGQEGVRRACDSRLIAADAAGFMVAAEVK